MTITGAGRVITAAKNRWTVQFEKSGLQVAIQVLDKGDPQFTRLDADQNGRLGYDEYQRKLVDTFCTPSIRTHIEDERLNLAADLMRRIDQRIESLQGQYAELAFWNDRLETVSQDFAGATFMHPLEGSSGRLFQVHYADHNRRHRLLYHNYNGRRPISISVRVVAASAGATYAMTPPHACYGRAWIIVEKLPSGAKLRQHILRVIQEESFKEPGPAGIERRAWTAAAALAHLATDGAFPDMRWGSPLSLSMSPSHDVLRDEGPWHRKPVEGRLILLCQPLNRKSGHNRILPVSVAISRIPAKNAD